MASKEDRPQTLDAFLERMTAGALDCRDMGHQWKPWGARWGGDAAGCERVLACPRGKTGRVQEGSRAGHVLSNRYHYPDGYLTPSGLPDSPGRVSRDLFRLESITRFTTKEGR